MKRPIIILILILLPSTIFLLLPGIYYNMHDDLQVVRQLEFEKCLKDLQIPCRWSPDLNFGYGFPMFNFYPPFPYVVGQIFRLFSFDFLTTVKLTAFCQIILSGIFMYLLVKELKNDNRAAFLTSVLYVYAPYHALNIFVRGAMNEAWASVFFPLILYFSLKLIKTSQPRFLFLLSFAVSLLLLSHLPMATIFLPTIYALSFLIGLKNGKKMKNILAQQALSLLIALGLTSFFVLPAILESNLTQIKTMFVGYYSYTAHFATLNEIFLNNFWNNGPSIWGSKDALSFLIGYVHWILPVIILLISFIKPSKIKLPYLFYCFLALAVFNLFMTHQRSIIIWDWIKIIQNIQFPWRFLNPATFYICLTSLYLIKITKNTLVYVLLVLLVIFINFSYFIPVQWGKVSEEQKLSGLSWQKMISNLYDYLPTTATKAAIKPAPPGIDYSIPENIYQVNSLKEGTNWKFINFTSIKEGKIILSQIDFPITQIYLNGVKINHSTESDFGRIVIDVPSGQHLLYIKLVDTPIRHIANIITLLTIFSLLIYLTWKKTLFQT